MILMLNGAFVAGKTTLANALLERRPEWMLFDPEEVGFMLWKLCPGPRGDFQDLAAWPPLVVETARALVAAYGRTLRADGARQPSPLQGDRPEFATRLDAERPVVELADEVLLAVE